jgi:hypothetical protein
MSFTDHFSSHKTLEKLEDQKAKISTEDPICITDEGPVNNS